MWAYGIVLIELVTQKEPYEGLDRLQVATRVAQGRLKPEIPAENCPAVLADLIRDCTQYEPQNRPFFRDICNTFQQADGR